MAAPQLSFSVEKILSMPCRVPDIQRSTKVNNKIKYALVQPFAYKPLKSQVGDCQGKREEDYSQKVNTNTTELFSSNGSDHKRYKYDRSHDLNVPRNVIQYAGIGLNSKENEARSKCCRSLDLKPQDKETELQRKLLNDKRSLTVSKTSNRHGDENIMAEEREKGDNFEVSPEKSRRMSLTKKQRARLEELFTHKSYIDPVDRLKYSKELEIPEWQIRNWFQNKRSRIKLIKAREKLYSSCNSPNC